MHTSSLRYCIQPNHLCGAVVSGCLLPTQISTNSYRILTIYVDALKGSLGRASRPFAPLTVTYWVRKLHVKHELHMSGVIG